MGLPAEGRGDQACPVGLLASALLHTVSEASGHVLGPLRVTPTGLPAELPRPPENLNSSQAPCAGPEGLHAVGREQAAAWGLRDGPAGRAVAGSWAAEPARTPAAYGLASQRPVRVQQTRCQDAEGTTNAPSVREEQLSGGFVTERRRTKR